MCLLCGAILTPLGGPGLASQPTLSRFTAMSKKSSMSQIALIPVASHLAKSASLISPAARLSIILTPSIVSGRKE
ncbi:hypothetical protein GCM10008966_34820 [Rhodovulum strictum]